MLCCAVCVLCIVVCLLCCVCVSVCVRCVSCVLCVALCVCGQPGNTHPQTRVVEDGLELRVDRHYVVVEL